MNSARASIIRVEKIKGSSSSNKAKKEKEQWTLNKLWKEYKTYKADLKCIRDNGYRYNKYIKEKFVNKLGKKVVKNSCN